MHINSFLITTFVGGFTRYSISMSEYLYRILCMNSGLYETEYPLLFIRIAQS